MDAWWYFGLKLSQRLCHNHPESMEMIQKVLEHKLELSIPIISDGLGSGSVSWPWNQTKPFFHNKNQTKLFKIYESHLNRTVKPYYLKPNRIRKIWNQTKPVYHKSKPNNIGHHIYYKFVCENHHKFAHHTYHKFDHHTYHIWSS